jgi:hypothetical protein
MWNNKLDQFVHSVQYIKGSLSQPCCYNCDQDRQCRTNSWPPVPDHSQQCKLKSVSLSTTGSVEVRGCIPFHRKLCGREDVSKSILNSVDVRVYPCPQSTVWTLVFSFPPKAAWIACSVAVQRVPNNSPCRWSCRVYPSPPPAAYISTTCCMDDRVYPTYTNSSVDVQGVSLFTASRKDFQGVSFFTFVQCF